MRLLMALLGNPHQRMKCAHVTGTNGKGSVCAFIQAALRCGGYRTGLYTSPYLQRFNERIRVDGAPIPDEALIATTNRVALAVNELRKNGVYPTEFEITTAIGFLYLADQNLDIAVIEVGLGGRFDSTNVIDPLVCAITSIALDHTKTLGGTVEQIAFEKAGIAKPGVPLILYPGAQANIANVVRRQCESVGAYLIELAGDCARPVNSNSFHGRCTFSIPDAAMASGEYRLKRADVALAGMHQYANAATALAAILMLKNRGFALSEAAIRAGLKRVRWPGRMEWVTATERLNCGGKRILLDGAHNPQGAQALAHALGRHSGAVAVVGMLRDKDAQGAARALAPVFRSVYTVAPGSSRAMSAQELAELYRREGTRAMACSSLDEALRRACLEAAASRWVVVTGSLYLVGQARTYLNAPDCSLLAEDAFDV
ncbi:MAG: bifunctional folylpolyglutamate synthase/dihydrofolate synthase [Oscillospiraceae bacterium]|jgi:dihydrofolate synthase/folylpolyglutamate synthase|nr:bifunctional folylpolyglutamate synthase/dihydrofolate synthase [Oscillospiraceae bacterium]